MKKYKDIFQLQKENKKLKEKLISKELENGLSYLKIDSILDIKENIKFLDKLIELLVEYDEDAFLYYLNFFERESDLNIENKIELIKQLSSEIFNLLKKSVHNFSPMFFLNDGFFVFSFGFNYLEIIAKAKLFISYYNQTYLAESFNLNIFLFSIRNYIKNNSNKSDKKNIDSNNFLNYLIESISKRNINESEQIIPINFDYDIINPEIFIIEPDSFNANIIINLLKNYNIECLWFIDGEEAYNKIKIYYPSCIVSEVNIPGLSIFELKQKLIEDDIDIPVILLSSKKNDDLLKLSKIHGISYYLKKPYYPTELISVIILFSIKFYENRKKRILS